MGRGQNIKSKYFSNSTGGRLAELTIGVANIDIFTGKTSLFQFCVEDNKNHLTYDELERYVSVYRPSECIIISNTAPSATANAIAYVGLDTCRKIHKVDLNKEDESNMVKCAFNAEKQKYQKEILTRFYPTMSDITLMESFSTHCIASQAFCFLLDFVYQHSPNLISKLAMPTYENHTDKLVLANHSLKQLNIIDDSRHTGKLRSVSSLINNCVTTMGKRSFMYNLYNPITNIEKLNDSYAITDHLLTSTSWQNIRKEISTIKDFEKLMRKMVLGKIVPKDFAMLAYDLRIIADLYNTLKGDQILNDYIIHNHNSESTDMGSLCTTIIAELDKIFALDKCLQMNDTGHLLDLEPDQLVFINKGISVQVDTLLIDSLESRERLETIRAYFSDIIKIKEKTKTKETEYIKIHETAKSNPVLTGTSRRVILLKSELSKIKTSTINLTYSTKETTKSFDLSIGDITYETPNSNTIITNTQIIQITSSIHNSKDKLVQELLTFFTNYISQFSQSFEPYLEEIKNYITLLDMLQCKCYIAHKYNYCRPNFAGGGCDAPSENECKPFIKFTGIRHPLIEHIQTNELYVTNDLHIGGYTPNPTKTSSEIDSEIANGILLFGTNAVGKTSFIKSIGISLVMAQAGLYVPCSTFEYRPYSYIFTRILGNDNLFKGLSTFAVEMSELRTIITQADENSLVLGDELCSGTESDSALSIFTAGLEHLHSKGSTFLFATHFHEIVKFDEIKALTHLKMKHMAVKYDIENDVLVYDRKLKDGAGDSMYGLEVCKSLSLPDKFLQRAHDIRMKYNRESQNILSLNTSHFSAQKIMSNCELCRVEKASEVHHLQHQKFAKTSNNYIDSFHKNHPKLSCIYYN
jgi:DNA mismatch repair protein MutS